MHCYYKGFIKTLLAENNALKTRPIDPHLTWHSQYLQSAWL